MYDIFFISFNESNAEQNWVRVKNLHPNAYRIHGIRSISKAHLVCNQLSSTDKFWTIDGDNWLLEKLPSYVEEINEFDQVQFTTVDAIDHQIDSAGSVKLWKKDSFVNTDMSKGDFCKFATRNSIVIRKTLSEHRYDATPFEAWRHSFRRMVKCFGGILPSNVIELNVNKLEKHKTLNIWSYRGYIDARKYVIECSQEFDKINLINDYIWLEQQFLKCTQQV